LKNWHKLLLILIIVLVILPLALVMLDKPKDKGKPSIQKGQSGNFVEQLISQT